MCTLLHATLSQPLLPNHLPCKIQDLLCVFFLNGSLRILTLIELSLPRSWKGDDHTNRLLTGHQTGTYIQIVSIASTVYTGLLPPLYFNIGSQSSRNSSRRNSHMKLYAGDREIVCNIYKYQNQYYVVPGPGVVYTRHNLDHHANHVENNFRCGD